MADLVVQVLNQLVPGGVRRGELRRGARMLRWVEAGSDGPAVIVDAGLGEPGSLAWAAVLPAIAARTRVIAYDRAGLGASDPAAPLTVDGQVADLVALATEAAGGRCIFAGHSWGGLLAQLIACDRPDLVSGLVLVDPAHEEILAAGPWPLRAAAWAQGEAFLLLHSLGLLGRLVRRGFGPFARRVSDDPQRQALLLDAYASCYASRAQTRTIRDETALSSRAAPRIREIRAASALPDVPVVVLSATKGAPGGIRARWTRLQAELAQPVAGGQHIVAEDTGHAIHQERPELVIGAVVQVLEQAT